MEEKIVKENAWWVYRGTGERPKPEEPPKFPAPPSWREFGSGQYEGPDRELTPADARGAKFQVSKEEKDLINAAIYLRRPLFITGKPGCGKSLLPYAVAYELGLGPVLRWPITTRVTLQDGLYHYDAIGRLQDSSLASKDAERKIPPIGDYLRLGPLGTALLPRKLPRVLLIDEIDKSDIDLPNDLLNIFEEGEYDIPELARLTKRQHKGDKAELEHILAQLSKEQNENDEVSTTVIPYGEKTELERILDRLSNEQDENDEVNSAVMPYDGKDENDKVAIEGGHVRCAAFPFVVLTSNDEREFPPAFLRRCIRMRMQFPDEERLTKIVKAHLGEKLHSEAEKLISQFYKRSEHGDMATDQLLNAVYLLARDDIKIDDQETMLKTLWHYLSSSSTEA